MLIFKRYRIRSYEMGLLFRLRHCTGERQRCGPAGSRSGGSDVPGSAC